MLRNGTGKTSVMAGIVHYNFITRATGSKHWLVLLPGIPGELSQAVTTSAPKGTCHGSAPLHHYLLIQSPK